MKRKRILLLLLSIPAIELSPEISFGQAPEDHLKGAYVAALSAYGGGAELFIGPSIHDPGGFPDRKFVEAILPMLHDRGMEAAYCPPGCLRNNTSPRKLHVTLSKASNKTKTAGALWITVGFSGGFGPQEEASWIREERYMVIERDGCWSVEQKERLRIS